MAINGTKGLMRVALIGVVLFAVLVAASCRSARDGAKSNVKTGAGEKASARPERAPLSAVTYEVLSPKVLGALADAPELKELRKRGILKVAVRCDRPNMCMRMKYGAAAGFEVELIRKSAEAGLGVKENIIGENESGADIRLGVPCGVPGGPPDKTITGADSTAGPYFYSSRTGWLCMESVRGGKPLADALDAIIRHFYNTGTFQQVYKNWFIPAAPDMEEGAT